MLHLNELVEGDATHAGVELLLEAEEVDQVLCVRLGHRGNSTAVADAEIDVSLHLLFGQVLQKGYVVECLQEGGSLRQVLRLAR